MGIRVAGELGLLNVLQHDARAALLGNHALVVGQIEGRGAHAVRAIARSVDFVHHADGRRRAQLRIAVLRVDRQVVLHFLQVRRDGLELVGLRFVADGDVGFEAGLVAEQLVVVGLVGADGDVERRVQIHPGDVAGVVVVGEEGIGAQGQEFLQRRVVGERGGFAQEAGRLLQIGGVRLVVGDEGQLLVGIAPDDGEEADGLFALRGRTAS